MKKQGILFGLLLLGAGCATIGPEHERLSLQVEKGIARQEVAYMKLVDRFEADALDRIDERMLYVEGPVIMKHAIAKSNFKKNICEIDGKLDQAVELLEFTMDASANYEKKKRGYTRALSGLVRGLRIAARQEFGLMRQASSTLTSGLRAYNKDKKWREDMMRSLNVPVDQVSALNDAAEKFDKILKDK